MRLTEITIPFGLLQQYHPEIAAELEEANKSGQKIQWYTGYWATIQTGTPLSKSRTYRLAPQPREFWRNEYPDGALSYSIYPSKEEADNNAQSRRLRAVLFREVMEDN